MIFVFFIQRVLRVSVSRLGSLVGKKPRNTQKSTEQDEAISNVQPDEQGQIASRAALGLTRNRRNHSIYSFGLERSGSLHDCESNRGRRFLKAETGIVA
jgi:hypothetical protein